MAWSVITARTTFDGCMYRKRTSNTTHTHTHTHTHAHTHTHCLQRLLQVYDCPTRRAQFVQQLERPGYCCVFSPDGRTIAVGLQGAPIPPSSTEKVHTVFVYGFPADKADDASGSGGGGGGRQDDQKQKQKQRFAASASPSPSRRTGGGGGGLGAPATEPARQLYRLFSWRHSDRNIPSSVTVLRFSPDGKTLLLGTDLGHVMSFDARPGNDFQLLCKVKRTSLAYINAMDFSACSTYVRVADSINNVACVA